MNREDPTQNSPTHQPTPQHSKTFDEVLRSVEDTHTRPAGSLKIKRKRWLWLMFPVLTILLVAGTLGWFWWSLQPANASDSNKQVIEILPGATPNQIAAELDEKNIIRSKHSFSLYTRLTGNHDSLQTGTYLLSPSHSVKDIVEHLSSGKTDQFNITFYPGATLYDNRSDLPDDQRTDVYTMLKRVGFSDQEIEAAFTAQYDHPLLADKPANASLEGYVYGDTYTFKAGSTAQDVLKRTFDVFHERIEARTIESELEEQGLNLHEGITLASIVEREVSGREQDQKQVAQVFYSRLEKDMPLGADATFQYAARQMNVAPTTDLDSPYNTRIHTGLPPGPISSPSIEALEAVANPADGDFLYFVSGDDGTTHFARTIEKHEENIRNYCTTLCEQP